MSARVSTVIRCNRIGCLARIERPTTPPAARAEAKALGWKVDVATWNRRDREDYCPEHKR